ncbi:MAG: hypothetical protein GEV06_12530 [Luteitalea sp.]|nr:hypothetical protein [Luteitalea sp.]
MRSRKARTQGKRRRAKPVLVAVFPELTQVLQGYLHEDFGIEHGSAHEAIAAYRADASDEERARFNREVGRFLRMVHGARISAIRRILARDFRSAWAPRSVAELRSVLFDREDESKSL